MGTGFFVAPGVCNSPPQQHWGRGFLLLSASLQLPSTAHREKVSLALLTTNAVFLNTLVYSFLPYETVGHSPSWLKADLFRHRVEISLATDKVLRKTTHSAFNVKQGIPFPYGRRRGEHSHPGATKNPVPNAAAEGSRTPPGSSKKPRPQCNKDFP